MTEDGPFLIEASLYREKEMTSWGVLSYWGITFRLGYPMFECRYAVVLDSADGAVKDVIDYKLVE